jgi:hypothetical protein
MMCDELSSKYTAFSFIFFLHVKYQHGRHEKISLLVSLREITNELLKLGK